MPSDGTPIVDKTVTVTLPAGKTVFDIDYLGLWCKQANADFGHVIIPPMAQLCLPPYIEKKVKPYYGKLIGELSGDGQGSATGHDVSGKVYAIDDKTLWIRDFTFDGDAPGMHSLDLFVSFRLFTPGFILVS